MTQEAQHPQPQGGTPAAPDIRFNDERAAIRLAQANQRLLQEQQIFERRLEHDKQVGLLQRCMGWVVLVMLPSIAVICVLIFFQHQVLPDSVVVAASGAFFVDIVGTVIAGYKSLMPAKLPAELSATTRDPFVETARQDAPSDAPQVSTAVKAAQSKHAASVPGEA